MTVVLKKIKLSRLLAVIAVAMLCAAAFAQSEQSADSRPEDGDSYLATESATTVSARQIVDLLRSRPDLIAEGKRLAAEQLRAQGRAVPDDSISDEMLFNRIAQDADFRNAVASWLQTQGYLNDVTPRPSARRSGAAYDDDEPAVNTRRKRSSSEDTAAEDEYNDQPEETESRGEPRLKQRVRDNRSSSDIAEDEEQSGRDDRRTSTRQRRADLDEQSRQEPQTTEKTIKRRTPYPNVPSLKDLYRQVPDGTAQLKRFGSDLFRRGNVANSAATMDLPAGPDYVLGPGDGLNINVWGGVSERVTRVVDREGRVALPEAGPVVVAGLSLVRAQYVIQEALAPQIRDAHVDVSVTRLRTVRIYVVGDVQRPGAYDVSSLSTPLNALYAAGGPTSAGSLRMVRHYRGKQLVKEVDLYELLLHGVRSDAERLQPGDSILVPPIGPQVTVSGMVRRPAIYELKGPTQSLADVLDIAGGVLVSANLRQIRVERVEAHSKREMLSINVPDGEDKASTAKALSSFQVQDGDAITIAPILPYSEKTVYVQGHVFRPGKYPYKPDMTISDLIRSYQDVLPEPAEHAEIIRLQAPDFRPETIEFNLSDVLAGDDPIKLQPFDTVRVFGRYEIDAPKVSIYGEILRPGPYPLADGMTVSALVRMAGGFKRSAYRDTADVASYDVKNGSKVQTKHTMVDLAKALEGNAAEDLRLKPGDVVTIRQISGWQDIGASVTLNGEVLYPGTYGIKEGEKLSDVIQRAGGFREGAYPSAATLDRIEVQKLSEKSRTELIRRIESSSMTLSANGSGQEQAAMMQAMLQQKEQVLSRLRNQPATGRLVVNISRDVTVWANTPADIEMRPGDVLTIPKRPNFVMVTGQVYNSTATSFVPGKSASWYLQQSGGPTDMANKKAIFIVRANGSIVSRNASGWFKGDVLSTKLHPGDTVVVPEKVVGGSMLWKNLMTAAQFAASTALTASVVVP